MKIDDSFKKPGSVPFKWEIRPGVPKLQTPQPQSGHYRLESGSEKQHHRKQKQAPQKQSQVSSPFPEIPRRLKPPPAGLYFQPPLEPRTRSGSFRSSPRTFSNRFSLPGLTRPDVVASAGCFPSPLEKLRNVKKGAVSPRSISEPEYYSDLGTPSRGSVSSRRSVSPLPSSFASYQSSPRPVTDADWAGFGLF